MKQIISFCLLLISLLSFSQEETVVEVIHLGNGSTLKGTIIDQDEDGFVTIKIVGGNELTYPLSDVKAIEYENPKAVIIPRTRARSVAYMRPPPHVPETDRTYQYLIFGWPAGFSNSGWRPGFSTHYVLGKQKSQYFSLGGGIGIDFYDLLDNGYGAFLFYVDYRGYLKKDASSTWYWKADLGYGHPIAISNWWRQVEGTRGGIYLSPAIGYRFGSRNKAHFFMEYGLSFLQMEYTITRNGGEFPPTTNPGEDLTIDIVGFNRNNFKIGIAF